VVQVVEKDVQSNTPLILASTPGFDASWRVDTLAAQLNKPMRAIAIGSAEGFELADKSINAAAKSGGWVMLKNIHLAPRWLVQLEKKLHTLQFHANFRLFMTTEIHPKLPASLLRQTQIFSFQPPPGMRANLQQTFASLPAARMEKAPAERSRIYFLLAWLHAVVQERLRYAPLGWSKLFEFSEADLRCAFDTVDYWLDSRAQGRSNLAPDRIPWEAVRTLLSQSVYGGRIDNEFDQRLLLSFLERVFTTRAFDLDFKLVEGDGSIVAPEGTTREHFVKWIDAMPDTQTPVWLGTSFVDHHIDLLLLTYSSFFFFEVCPITPRRYCSPSRAGASCRSSHACRASRRTKTPSPPPAVMRRPMVDPRGFARWPRPSPATCRRCLPSWRSCHALPRR
jgi:dynein heavy chain 1